MHMEGLTVGAGCNKQQTDFNASCVSVLAEDFLDPMDGALGSDLHDSQVSDLDLDSSVFGSDVSDSESGSGSDSESESESEDEEDENDAPQPQARAAPRKRGLIARMASSDSLFGGGRGMPPRRPPKAESKGPRRGFLARMASNDSLFGGPRGAPPRRPTNESSSKPNRRGLLSRMNSSDSLFAGIMPSFGKSHKPHATKTRRGGRRNRGGTKQEEDDAPKRGVIRMNTDDSLIPAPTRSVKRTSTSDTLEAAKSNNDSDKVTPPSTRTRRGGRRNRADAPEQKDTAPPQRGVARNNTSDSLVQSSRPSRRAGRRPPKPSAKCPDSPNGGLTEGESCSESSLLVENAANLITI